MARLAASNRQWSSTGSYPGGYIGSLRPAPTRTAEAAVFGAVIGGILAVGCWSAGFAALWLSGWAVRSLLHAAVGGGVLIIGAGIWIGWKCWSDYWFGFAEAEKAGFVFVLFVTVAAAAG